MNYINNIDINEIHIELSSRCKLQCLHCSSDKMIKMGNSNFSLLQLSDFLDYFPRSCHVYFTGGEPMLSPIIYDAIQICKDKGLSVGLFSTFFINDIENAMRSLNKLRLDDIYFSIYDNNSTAHDLITGVKGSFDNSLKAISFAIKYGIQPKINLVLLKTNIDRIDEIILWFDRMGLQEIRILKLVDHGRATTNWERIGVSFKEQWQCAKEIFKRYGVGIHTRITYSGFPNITPCRPFKSDYLCGAANTLLYVADDGSIYPCASQKNNPQCLIGNISDPLQILHPEFKSKCYIKEN